MRTRYIILIRRIILTLLVLTSVSAAKLAQAETVEVTAGVLGVWAGPGSVHGRIGYVRKGQKYVSVKRQGAWHKIDFDHRQGWIVAYYVKSSSTPSVTVRVGSKLNVRSGAGTRYRDVGDTYNGQQWVVAGNSGSWKKVNYRGGTYWMHGDYLSSGGTVGPTPRLPKSRAGLVQLPRTGSGFKTYERSSYQWGTTKMVYGLMRAADKRIRDNSNQGRVNFGRISRSNGAKPTSIHATHKYGKYADMRPLGAGKYDSRIDLGKSTKKYYSQSRTRSWIKTYLRGQFGGSMARPLFNDSKLIREGVSRYVGGHHNHIHIKVN